MISVTNSDKGSFTMKFSTRDRYALRLMVELANRPNDLIPLKDISDKQRISLKYLEQIVTPLAKAGLVSSVRGAQGGYRLARPAGEITSGEILRAVEGELTAIPWYLMAAKYADHPVQGMLLQFVFSLVSIFAVTELLMRRKELGRKLRGGKPADKPRQRSRTRRYAAKH